MVVGGDSCAERENGGGVDGSTGGEELALETNHPVWSLVHSQEGRTWTQTNCRHTVLRDVGEGSGVPWEVEEVKVLSARGLERSSWTLKGR